MATAQKTKKNEKARFVADGIGLRVTIDHPKEQFIDNRKVVVDPGFFAEFTPDGVGGQFYETTDERVIAILREKAEGGDPKFAEVPILKPDSAPVLKQVMALAVRGDSAALVKIAREEEETHQREDVLDAIADALEQIGS